MQSVRLLISEEAGMLRESYEAVLCRYGIEVYFCAGIGTQVLDTIFGRMPHVVLLNLHYRGHDAIGIKKAVDEKLPGHDILFLLKGRQAQDPYFEKARQHGFHSYLQEPFDCIHLAERLLAHFGLSRLERPRKDAIHAALEQLCLPAGTNGFRYLAEAVMMVSVDGEMIRQLHSYIYPVIAGNHNTTAAKVDSTIRYAIETAWERGAAEILAGLPGHARFMNRKLPGNAEFILAAAELAMGEAQGWNRKLS